MAFFRPYNRDEFLDLAARKIQKEKVTGRDLYGSLYIVDNISQGCEWEDERYFYITCYAIRIITMGQL